MTWVDGWTQTFSSQSATTIILISFITCGCKHTITFLFSKLLSQQLATQVFYICNFRFPPWSKSDPYSSRMLCSVDKYLITTFQDNLKDGTDRLCGNSSKWHYQSMPHSIPQNWKSHFILIHRWKCSDALGIILSVSLKVTCLQLITTYMLESASIVLLMR